MKLPLAIVPLIFAFALSNARAQLSKTDREAVKTIAREVVELIEKRYYIGPLPPEFLSGASQIIAELNQCASLDETQVLIADLVRALPDGQSVYFPPNRQQQWRHVVDWQVFGASAFITIPDESGGLVAGDVLLAVEGIPVDRASSNQIKHLVHILLPRPELMFHVRSQDGTEKALTVRGTLAPARDPQLIAVDRQVHPSQGPEVMKGGVVAQSMTRHGPILRGRPGKVGRLGNILIYRLPDFFSRPAEWGLLWKELKDCKTLILDLRNNRGGSTDEMASLLSGLLPRGETFATVHSRQHRIELKTSEKDKGTFAGNVVVLVNHSTSGPGELVARVLQQRQRAVIVGDRTPGRTMGVAVQVLTARRGAYIASVHFAEEEIRFADGSSVQGTGVAPDLQILPSSGELAAAIDIELERALALAGRNTIPGELGLLAWNNL